MDKNVIPVTPPSGALRFPSSSLSLFSFFPPLLSLFFPLF